MNSETNGNEFSMLNINNRLREYWDYVMLNVKKSDGGRNISSCVGLTCVCYILGTIFGFDSYIVLPFNTINAFILLYILFRAAADLGIGTLALMCVRLPFLANLVGFRSIYTWAGRYVIRSMREAVAINLYSNSKRDMSKLANVVSDLVSEEYVLKYIDAKDLFAFYNNNSSMPDNKPRRSERLNRNVSGRNDYYESVDDGNTDNNDNNNTNHVTKLVICSRNFARSVETYKGQNIQDKFREVISYHVNKGDSIIFQ